MSERSDLIARLHASVDTRASYIKSKLGVLVPSQIRALRLQSEMPRQADLARAAGLHQSRISMFETPGAANMTLETLARLAATFQVGLMVKFVPLSEMLYWENGYSADHFHVTPLPMDMAFADPEGYEEQLQRSGGAGNFGSKAQDQSEGVVGKLSCKGDSSGSDQQTDRLTERLRGAAA